MTRRIALLLPAAAALLAQAPADREAELRLLLNPKALAARPAPETAAQLRQAFADPPAEYRSMPLWVWNDLLEWPRLKQMLAEYKQQGMGGVFVHPRPGLMTEYMGADWWRLWKLAQEEGKRLGLLVNIYDENSYPSGFAGGHVPALAPDTAAQYVQAEFDADPSTMYQRRGVTVAFFAVERTGNGEVRAMKRVTRPSEIPTGHTLLAFRLKRASGNPWTAEFPYVDLTNPQTAPAFLKTTYEHYKREAGLEFGKTTKWAFTDEPLLATGGAYDSASLALPLSYNTLAEFRKRCGYDLEDHLPSLYWDAGDYRKVRFDYWQTMHDLWKENFMRPMFQWCDRNNLQFTGHWMEHEWPYPWITPADANLYAYEHVPGIDMLEGARLRSEGKDPHLLFTIKQVASVSHQLGRRVFCEAYGVAGWDSTFEHYKRFGDWLMVHGVNFMDQHLSFTTVRGARKRDHPQSFSDISPWWPYYRMHADHLGRVSYLSSRSEPRHRLLVLEQTTSGFLLARRGAATPELASMRANNAEMNQFLADHQVDYDLGDEYMIEWFGKVEGKKFAIAKAAYELVVIPPDMSNMRSQTLPVLEKYLAAGGEVVTLSPPAVYVDGRPSERVRDLQGRYQAQWHAVTGLPDLLAEVRRRLPPRILFEDELPAGIGFSERYLANGDRILFLTNTGLRAMKTRATVEASSLEAWDTVTGKMETASFAAAGAGRVKFDVELPPAGSMLLLASKSAGASRKQPQVQYAGVSPAPWQVRADAPNVLVLDYCDYTAGGASKQDVNTWQANWDIWQSHGFERPAWDNAVQFRRGIFDRNKFGKDSGFEATFRFETADAAALKGLQLAIEEPRLYQVTVNGSTVDFQESEQWLDPHLRALDIEKYAKIGENVVKLAARPFDVSMELENIYLRGPFFVEAAAKGFRLAGRGKLDFGPWAKQGYRFYAGAVSYETEVIAPAGKNRLRVTLGEWKGSVVSVLLDEKQVGVIGWEPWSAEFAAAPGKHKLAVRVVSTPRNLFGPFHNPGKPRMRAWPAAWADFPEHQPAGQLYDVLDYGLMSPPVVEAVSEARP